MLEEFMSEEELRKDIKDTIKLFDNCKDIVDKAISNSIISENKY